MLLTKEKIKTIFKKLLNKKISREEVNQWAYDVVMSNRPQPPTHK
jgi:hypothetical protein